MQRYNEFRLSQLYLACRTLGARHILTHEVLNLFAMSANPALTSAVMNAPATYGDSQIIAFRRNPIDLRFACMLVGSTGKAAREGFIICSDEALGYIGALGISTALSPHYSLEENPRVPVILEEHDIFRALDALALPTIMQATLQVDADRPDILHIALPTPLRTDTSGKQSTQTTLDAFKFRVFPRATPPEVLPNIKLKRVDTHGVVMKIAPEHLMVCHNAGLQGLAFELITPEFALEGTFPDMLDTPAPHRVHHSPVGLFHGIFKGLDDQLLILPDDIAYALRDAIDWLKQPEFVT